MDVLAFVFGFGSVIVGGMLLWTTYTKSGKKWLQDLN